MNCVKHLQRSSSHRVLFCLRVWAASVLCGYHQYMEGYHVSNGGALMRRKWQWVLYKIYLCLFTFLSVFNLRLVWNISNEVAIYCATRSTFYNKIKLTYVRVNDNRKMKSGVKHCILKYLSCLLVILCQRSQVFRNLTVFFGAVVCTF